MLATEPRVAKCRANRIIQTYPDPENEGHAHHKSQPKSQPWGQKSAVGSGLRSCDSKQESQTINRKIGGLTPVCDDSLFIRSYPLDEFVTIHCSSARTRWMYYPASVV
jgi:hypothetical protein